MFLPPFQATASADQSICRQPYPYSSAPVSSGSIPGQPPPTPRAVWMETIRRARSGNRRAEDWIVARIHGSIEHCPAGMNAEDWDDARIDFVGHLVANGYRRLCRMKDCPDAFIVACWANFLRDRRRHLRVLERWEVSMVRLEDLDIDASNEDFRNPEAILLDRERSAEVWRSLSILTPEQRRIVELFLGGLTHPEIAASTGISPVAVRKSFSRAMQLLREITGLSC